LCNLVAQSPSNAEGGLQEGDGKGTDRAGKGTVGDYLIQGVQMLGSDRSRGYCAEMICADFLAGANLDNGDPETLLFSMTRFFKFLPGKQRQAFLGGLSEKAS
jgi:hypothetical protein